MATQSFEGVIWLYGPREGLGSRGLAAIRRAWQARRTRRQLAEMDDRMLADIGFSRAEAYEEARRAPWDTAPRRG